MNEPLKTYVALPMTALSSSWGFCLFGSLNWARTASRALWSWPFRMKCSKNLTSHIQSQKTYRQELSISLLTSFYDLQNHQFEVYRHLWNYFSPCRSQCPSHTHIIILGDPYGFLHFLQHFRSSGVHGHHWSQLRHTVHLTVHFTASNATHKHIYYNNPKTSA